MSDRIKKHGMGWSRRLWGRSIRRLGLCSKLVEGRSGQLNMRLRSHHDESGTMKLSRPRLAALPFVRRSRGWGPEPICRLLYVSGSPFVVGTLVDNDASIDARRAARPLRWKLTSDG